MTEILWHGRGGQGAFTAARLLGAAYVAESDGFYALAFPSFGPERRGAPIRAFTKLSDSPVGDRSQVVRADYSIYLDDTLFTDAAFDELKENGKIILNTRRKVDDERVITLDGTAIAQEILHMPITNTIMRPSRRICRKNCKSGILPPSTRRSGRWPDETVSERAYSAGIFRNPRYNVV